MSSWRSLCWIAAAAVVAGCSGGMMATGGTVADPASRAAGPFSCGTEVIDADHQGYRADLRDCLWESCRAGKPAEFVTTAHTVEGDPITYRVRMVSSSQIEVELDTTQDRFGDGQVVRWTCSGAEMSEFPAGKTVGGIDRQSFTFSAGGDSDEVHIPW